MTALIAVGFVLSFLLLPGTTVCAAVGAIAGLAGAIVGAIIGFVLIDCRY